jgi:hypothetical protein
LDKKLQKASLFFSRMDTAVSSRDVRLFLQGSGLPASDHEVEHLLQELLKQGRIQEVPHEASASPVPLYAWVSPTKQEWIPRSVVKQHLVDFFSNAEKPEPLTAFHALLASKNLRSGNGTAENIVDSFLRKGNLRLAEDNADTGPQYIWQEVVSPDSTPPQWIVDAVAQNPGIRQSDLKKRAHQENMSTVKLRVALDRFVAAGLLFTAEDDTETKNLAYFPEPYNPTLHTNLLHLNAQWIVEAVAQNPGTRQSDLKTQAHQENMSTVKLRTALKRLVAGGVLFTAEDDTETKNLAYFPEPYNPTLHKALLRLGAQREEVTQCALAIFRDAELPLTEEDLGNALVAQGIAASPGQVNSVLRLLCRKEWVKLVEVDMGHAFVWTDTWHPQDVSPTVLKALAPVQDKVQQEPGVRKSVLRAMAPQLGVTPWAISHAVGRLMREGKIFVTDVDPRPDDLAYFPEPFLKSRYGHIFENEEPRREYKRMSRYNPPSEAVEAYRSSLVLNVGTAPIEPEMLPPLSDSDEE